MSSRQNIYQTLKPLFYLTRIICLAPFQLDNYKFQAFSYVNFAWSILLISFQLYYSYFYILYVNHYEAIIIASVEYLNSATSSIGIIITILKTTINYKKIIEIVNNLHDFDIKLFQFGIIDIQFITTAYKKRRNLLAFVAIIIWIIILLYYFLVVCFLKSFTINGILSVGSYIISFCSIFIEMQFCAFLLLLKERFKWLNNKITSDSKSFFYFSATIKEQISKYEIIAAMHYRLCNIGRKIVKMYSFLLLFIILQSFLNVIETINYLVGSEIKKDLDSYMNVSITIFILGYYSTAIVTLVTICTRTKIEAEKLRSIINSNFKSFEQQRSKLINFELQVMCTSLQTIQLKLKFHTCGLFLLNNTFLYTMVSAITTYTIIVIQFTRAIDNKQ